MVLGSDHYIEDSVTLIEVLMPTANLLDSNIVNNFYMNLCIGFLKTIN